MSMLTIVCLLLMAGSPATLQAKKRCGKTKQHQELHSVKNIPEEENKKAAAKSRPNPDFTSKTNRVAPFKSSFFNLGATGARGWIYKGVDSTRRSRQILVFEIEGGSPAHGKLKHRDVILGVDGKKFTYDARMAFGEALGQAEKKENKGLLNLMVYRKRVHITVTLQLEVMGSYGDMAPYECDKSKAIIKKSADYLMTLKFNSISGVFNALALLSTGEKKYFPVVKAFAQRIASNPPKFNYDKAPKGLVSWGLGHNNLLLTEYYLATKDETVLPGIKAYTEYIALGQNGVGAWGHGIAHPENANNNGMLHGLLPAYGAMNNAGLTCYLSLLLAQKCGVESKELTAALKRSKEFFSHYIGRGGMPYGDHRAGHHHAANGKNALAAVIFGVQKNYQGQYFYSRNVTSSFNSREGGHTGYYFNLVWGNLGAHYGGPLAQGAFFKRVAWQFDLARHWKTGKMHNLGWVHDSNKVNKYLHWESTGAYLLAYTTPRRFLYITGKDMPTSKKEPVKAKKSKRKQRKKKKEKLKKVAVKYPGILSPKEVEEAIAQGRNFYFVQVPGDDIYKYLFSWSGEVRKNARVGIRGKWGLVLKKIEKMLESKKHWEAMGACEYVTFYRNPTPAMTDKLIKLLKHKYMPLREAAIMALCATGHKEKTRIVEAILKNVPTDGSYESAKHAEHIAYCLFGSSNRGIFSWSGLLYDARGNAFRGIKFKLLVPNFKRSLMSKNGAIRSMAVKCLMNESYEKVKAVLPTVIKMTDTPYVSGAMFGASSRRNGCVLLAKHGVKAALPRIEIYLKVNEKTGKAQWGIYSVLAAARVLRYFGKDAKYLLPQTVKLLASYKKHPLPYHHKDKHSWTRDRVVSYLERAIEAMRSAEGHKTLRDIEGHEFDSDPLTRVDTSKMSKGVLKIFKKYLKSKKHGVTYKALLKLKENDDESSSAKKVIKLIDSQFDQQMAEFKKLIEEGYVCKAQIVLKKMKTTWKGIARCDSENKKWVAAFKKDPYKSELKIGKKYMELKKKWLAKPSDKLKARILEFIEKYNESPYARWADDMLSEG